MPKTLLPFLLVPLLLAVPRSADAAGDAKKALGEVRAAVKRGNADDLEGALRKVVAAGGKPAAKGLLSVVTKFPQGKVPLYWQVVDALSSFQEQKARLSLVREKQVARRNYIRGKIAQAPFCVENSKKVLEKIGEHLSLSRLEWKDHLDEFQEKVGLKVDDHQPIFYVTKLWNDLDPGR